MLAIERRNEILEKLQAERRVVVSELSQFYKVSEETIRRDLEKLVNDGYAIKSYGGAVINENTNIDLPFKVRKNHNVIGKQRIAGLFNKMVKDGDSIMLDASSTAVYVVKALKDKKNLTVITNSVEIIIELLDVPDWKILSTGGVSREGSFALVGPQTDRMLRSYHVDKAVISCKRTTKEPCWNPPEKKSWWWTAVNLERWHSIPLPGWVRSHPLSQTKSPTSSG